MQHISVIGAGGFVGSSLIESLVFDGDVTVGAVVRAYRNFAGLCRHGSAVTIHVADAEDARGLARAIQGSSIVVNVTTGPPASIVRSTRTIYDACVSAQVRRLIHLSSAVVYGEVQSDTINDDSPPLARHWMPYARAKAASEIWLRSTLESGSLETVVLRPGIVWGVRSPHTMNITQSLLRKDAFLVSGGAGIFNGIYIDNLITSIRACCDYIPPVSGFFNVGDAELITWRTFYSAFAEWLGADIHRLPNISSDRFPWSKRAVFDYVQDLPVVNRLYHSLKTRLPDGLKSAVKSYLANDYDYEHVARSYTSTPSVDRETWHLQRVKYKLPTAKFERQFEYAPAVSFQEGVMRTIRWLAFLGYAKVGATHANVA